MIFAGNLSEKVPGEAAIYSTLQAVCSTFQEPSAGEVMCCKPGITEIAYCKRLVREGSRKNLFFPPVFPWHPLVTSLTLCQMLTENGEIFKGIIIIFLSRQGRVDLEL